MKTLYERLSVKNRLTIDAEAKKYPSMWENIKQSLNNFYWNTMPIGQAHTLLSTIEPKKPFDYTAFSDLFEPKQ